MPYFFLAVGIVFEIVALVALKESRGFTRFLPAGLFVASLAASFYFEALALRTLPIGMTYAVWAGVGIVGMGVVGVLFYGESLNIGTVAGMTFVIIGVCAMLHWTPGDGAETASNQNDPAPAKTYLSTASR